MGNFEADVEIQQIAEAYALDMIDYAKHSHGVDLDWSDDSVQQVERIAALLHDDYEKTQPSPEKIAPFYKMLGSYIGTTTESYLGSWVHLRPMQGPLGSWDPTIRTWGSSASRRSIDSGIRAFRARHFRRDQCRPTGRQLAGWLISPAEPAADPK